MVADAVLMRAAEAAAQIAGQQGAGREIAVAALAAVAELSGQHGSDGERAMPLLELSVTRAGAAQEFA